MHSFINEALLGRTLLAIHASVTGLLICIRDTGVMGSPPAIDGLVLNKTDPQANGATLTALMMEEIERSHQLIHRQPEVGKIPVPIHFPQTPTAQQVVKEAQLCYFIAFSKLGIEVC